MRRSPLADPILVRVIALVVTVFVLLLLDVLFDRLDLAGPLAFLLLILAAYATVRLVVGMTKRREGGDKSIMDEPGFSVVPADDPAVDNAGPDDPRLPR